MQSSAKGTRLAPGSCPRGGQFVGGAVLDTETERLRITFPMNSQGRQRTYSRAYGDEARSDKLADRLGEQYREGVYGAPHIATPQLPQVRGKDPWGGRVEKRKHTMVCSRNSCVISLKMKEDLSFCPGSSR